MCDLTGLWTDIQSDCPDLRVCFKHFKRSELGKCSAGEATLGEGV